jgi:hypothetical protein
MKKLILILALSLFSVVPAWAQTYLTTTTLNGAVTSASATSINLTAATTAAVGGAIYVDHEAMTITAVSGTRISVVRGAMGTNAATHATGATVIIAPVAALQGTVPAFTQLNGRQMAGSCNPANYRYLPIVDTDSGNVFLCWAFADGGPRVWSFTNIVRNNGQTSLLTTVQ